MSELGQRRRYGHDRERAAVASRADIIYALRTKCGEAKIPAYSISSSAMLSKPEEMVSLSALAVFMLMASSNLVGCKTGRSAGFLPIRIWPVRVPPCWYSSAELAP